MSKIHSIENLRSIHPLTRREKTLKIEIPNFRLLYMKHMRGLQRSVNERAAQERNPAYRRFRNLGEERRLLESREFLRQYNSNSEEEK